MLENVKELLAKQLRIDKERISEESGIMSDLGADSLDILQILMTIEEDYGIVIPDESLACFLKVSDIVNYLESNM